MEEGQRISKQPPQRADNREKLPTLYSGLVSPSYHLPAQYLTTHIITWNATLELILSLLNFKVLTFTTQRFQGNEEAKKVGEGQMRMEEGKEKWN